MGAEREESTARQTHSTLDGLFALYEFRPFEALTLTGGLRSDDHDQFGSETTARLAAAWQASSSVTLRGSWGQGFKAPTIFQTTFFCCGAAAPNEELKPERSKASTSAPSGAPLEDAARRALLSSSRTPWT